MKEMSPNGQGSSLSAEQIFIAARPLVDHFGIVVDPQTGGEAYAAALAQLNPRFVGDRHLVRWKLEADQTRWPEETTAVIKEAAEAMNMLKPETPLQGRFDLVLVLGGSRQAPADRARYAAQCLFNSADFSKVVVLGSRRLLDATEQANVANYAPNAQTEADLAEATIEVLEQEDNRLANVHGINPKLPYVYSHIVEKERANNPDVIGSLLAEITAYGTPLEYELPKNFRLGAVTTQIYQSAVHLDLTRVAKGYGINEVFTAGNPSDPNVIAKRTTATYLGEILRTLRAASYAL